MARDGPQEQLNNLSRHVHDKHELQHTSVIMVSIILSKHETLSQCWVNVEPESQTVVQRLVLAVDPLQTFQRDVPFPSELFFK